MSDVVRIAIFGTESTGKTRLTQRLAEHFGEPWSAEYVRGFWERHGGVIVATDLEAIAQGQVAGEEDATTRARRVVFCDTELITCTLWDDLLFPGACPAWVRAEAERRARGFALYLLCEADVPFVPDPQRCFPDATSRERAGRMWRDALVLRGLPLVAIQGDWVAREARAVAAVKRVLGAVPQG